MVELTFLRNVSGCIPSVRVASANIFEVQPMLEYVAVIVLMQQFIAAPAPVSVMFLRW